MYDFRDKKLAKSKEWCLSSFFSLFYSSICTSFKTGPNGAAALCSPFAAYSDVGEENKKQAISTISEDGEFVDWTTIISGSHHHKIY
jgi:hypothetical protein